MLSSPFNDLTCKNTELINIIIKNLRKKTELFRLDLFRFRCFLFMSSTSKCRSTVYSCHCRVTIPPMRIGGGISLQDQSILFGVDFDDLGGFLAALGSHFSLYFAWWLPRKKFPSLKGGVAAGRGGCCGSLKISLLCQPLSLRVRSNCYRRY